MIRRALLLLTLACGGADHDALSDTTQPRRGPCWCWYQNPLRGTPKAFDESFKPLCSVVIVSQLAGNTCPVNCVDGACCTSRRCAP